MIFPPLLELFVRPHKQVNQLLERRIANVLAVASPKLGQEALGYIRPIRQQIGVVGAGQLPEPNPFLTGPEFRSSMGKISMEGKAVLSSDSRLIKLMSYIASFVQEAFRLRPFAMITLAASLDLWTLMETCSLSWNVTFKAHDD